MLQELGYTVPEGEYGVPDAIGRKNGLDVQNGQYYPAITGRDLRPMCSIRDALILCSRGLRFR